MKIDLPFRALLTDDFGETYPVVVIQAETADGLDLVGYRDLDGGDGVCAPDALRPFDDGKYPPV